MSSLVTLATPGVSADSNGLFHGMGDHADELVFAGWTAHHRPAEQSVLQSDSARRGAVDGGHRGRATCGVWRQDQPGDRRDHALGPGIDHAARRHHHLLWHVRHARTSMSTSSYGGKNWGNFIAANGLEHRAASSIRRSSRSSMPMATKQNVFDRFDYVFSQNDALHINSQIHPLLVPDPELLRQPELTASSGPDGNLVGPTDQRSKILTFNIAPYVDAHHQHQHGVHAARASCGAMASTITRSDNPFADLARSSSRRSRSSAACSTPACAGERDLYQGHSTTSRPACHI